jgi:hypothetical protein
MSRRGPSTATPSTPRPNAHSRLIASAASTPAPPEKMGLERKLARDFVELGVAKSALEIFERPEMWEETVGARRLSSSARGSSTLCAIC